MNDYQRIAQAINYLDQHRAEQPDLTTVAAAVGLRVGHFHRLFRAWAGATPKDFLQCLTLSHAKELLRQGEDVLAASLGAGLSGPGRLHDLCVSLEAATPGEIKARGAGLQIRTGIAESPFGMCLIGETARGICHLSFFDGDGREAAMAELHTDWPLARLVYEDEFAIQLAARIFTPAAKNDRLQLYVKGTAFQLRVWRTLLKIQPGTLVSYGAVATASGNPNASRAVGTAVGHNAISFLIPCHRVIRETGISGSYRWGGVRKRAILAWENGQHDSSHE